MAAPAATLHLRILAASPRLEDSYGIEIDFPKGKALALLGYLAVQREPVSRDQLAHLFWPDVAAARQRGSLRQALWAIRNRLGPDLLVGEDTVRVAPGALTLDLETFHALLQGSDLPGAMALWTAPPFGDFQIGQAPDWDRWKEQLQLAERERLADRLTMEAGRLLEQSPRPVEGGPPYSDPVHLLRLATHVQPGRLRRYEALVQVLLERRWLDEAQQIIEEARSVLADPRSQASLDTLESQRLLLERRVLPAEKRDRSIRLPFCGRADELGQLLEQWRDALAGATGISVLFGESGVGKTRLAHEIQTVAEREGARTVQVKGEATESPPVWGLLNDLVSQLLRQSGAGGVSPVTDATLRNLGLEADPATDSGRVTVRGPRLHPSLALTDALLDLISAVAEDGPLWILVDDLHWSDTKSRAVLARVVSRLPQNLSLQWLFTSWDMSELGRAATTVEQIEGAGFSRSLRLAPWSYPAMRDALQTRITFRGDMGLGREVLLRIHEVTRGNPLFVLELLAVFVEEGIMVPQGEHFWAFDVEKVPANLPLPASVRALVERHLAHLSSEATEVATALARLGRPASPRTLGTQAGLRDSEVTGALGELQARRMIRWVDDRHVDFLHDELRSAISVQSDDRIGLTSGGGKPWSMFRTLALASMLLLGLSSVVFLAAGPERMAEGPWGGGTLVTTRGDAPARAFTLRGVAGLSIREIAPPAPAPTGWPESLRVVVDSPSPPAPGVRDSGSAEGATGQAEATLLYRSEPDGVDVVLGRLPLPLSRMRLAPDHGALALLGGPGPGPGRLHVHLGGIWHTSPEPDVEVLDMDWCGSDRLMVLGRRGNASGLWEWRPGQPEPPRRVELGRVSPGAALACAPNGSAVVLAGALDGTGGLFLYALQSRSVTRLQTGPDFSVPDRIDWVSRRQRSGPVVLSLQGIEGDTLTLDAGAQLPLRARITHASGQRDVVSPRWRIEDPGLAEVQEPAVLQALRPGVTQLHALWGVGLTRVVTLVINEAEDPALLAEVPRDVLVSGTPVTTPSFGLGAGLGTTVEARVRWDDAQLREAYPARIVFTLCLQGITTGQEACTRIDLPGTTAVTPRLPATEMGSEVHVGTEEPTPGTVSLRTDPFFPPARIPLKASWIRPLSDEGVREIRVLLAMDPGGHVIVSLLGATRLEAPIRLQPRADSEWQAVLEAIPGERSSPPIWIHSLKVWEGERW
jgi:hypothetical protein